MHRGIITFFFIDLELFKITLSITITWDETGSTNSLSLPWLIENICLLQDLPYCVPCLCPQEPGQWCRQDIRG